MDFLHTCYLNVHHISVSGLFNLQTEKVSPISVIVTSCSLTLKEPSIAEVFSASQSVLGHPGDHFGTHICLHFVVTRFVVPEL